MRILYFAPIPFDGLKQRPQYLAEGLAKNHEVVYVEPTVSVMKYLLKGGERPAGQLREAGRNLHVLRLSGWLTAHRSLEAVTPLFCLAERLQLRKHLRWAELVWIGYAPWYGLVKSFRGRIVYDKMDEDRSITRNRLLRRLIEGREPQLVERADLIFVTAQRFYDALSPRKARVCLVKNALDPADVPQDAPPAADRVPGERVFGYVGMISHWFDMEAIRTILEADEGNRVVLVGPTEIPRLDHPRLQYVGAVPKAQVAGWIQMFDVCLYPFLKTPFLDTVDPVKIYEYLAQNKPVLAADSAEVRRFGSLLVRYGDPAALKAALAGPFVPPFANPRQLADFREENTWDRRVRQIEGELVR